MESSTTSIPDIPSVDLRTLHGPLTEYNYQDKDGHSVLDFSLNGLVAFGSQHVVVVCDSKSCRVIQTLNRHKCPVQRVRFPPDTTLKVASSDLKGCILVWDIIRSAVTTFILPNDRKETKGSRVVSFEWLPLSDDRKNHILVLYSCHVFMSFDADSGKVTSSRSLATGKVIYATPSTFALNPFDGNDVILPLSPVNPNQLQCSFLHVESHFDPSSSPTTGPVTNGLRIFRIFVSDFLSSKESDLCLGVKHISSALSKMDDENDDSFKIEMKSVTFSRNQRNQVIVVSTRVIAIINISSEEVVTFIPLDRSTSNIQSLISCQQRNGLFCLNGRNGVVSLRILQPSAVTLAISSAMPSADNIVSFAVDPLNESLVVLLASSGRLTFVTLQSGDKDQPKIPLSLADLVPAKWYNFEENRIQESLTLKRTSTVTCLSRTTVIKACPPVTRSNWEEHRPLLAVGSSTGSISVVNLSTGQTEKEMLIHLSAVRGIEWTSLTTFVSFSFLKDDRSGSGTNELYLTDLTTGKSRVMRKESIEYSPIQGVKCSHLRHYLLVAFRDSSLEVWDLKEESLIKVLPDKFCGVYCIEWSPISSRKTSTATSASAVNESTERIKENFIVNDASGDLYHFSVEGRVVTEVSQIKGDHIHGSLTALAWKGDQVVLGFHDGSLLFWDLKKKASTTKSSTRDVVRKVKFAPGKGNPYFLVLYQESLEVWNHTSPQTEIKFMKDVIVFTVIDVDWAGSDRPVLLTSDSQVLVTDLTLNRFSSPIKIERRAEKVSITSNLHLVKESVRFRVLTPFIHEEDPLTAEGIVSRAIIAARLAGNKYLVDFWTLVSHHVLDMDIDPSYDIYLKNETYRKIQADVIRALKTKRTITEAVIDFDLISGDYQQAVQTLLDSPPTSGPKYLIDSLKACLVASVSSSDAAKASAEPVVKLVAASLITSGEVREGVQLLLLMGKILDACRHLQSHGHWEKSLWVSKMALKEEESVELVTRWLENLSIESNSHHQQVFILVSHHLWSQVLSLLMNRHEVQTAALFALVCQMKGLSLATPSPSSSPSKESSSSDLLETIDYIKDQYQRLLHDHHLKGIQVP